MLIKNYIPAIFRRKKVSPYEIARIEKEAEFDSILKILNKEMHKDDDYYSQNSFNIAEFLTRKVENYLNINLTKYFNRKYGYNEKLDDILEETLDKKLEEKFSTYFTKESEDRVIEKLKEFSKYDITGSTAFEKFIEEYLKENKGDLHYIIRKICDEKEFLDTLSEKVGEEIGDMIQDKVKTCAC